MTMAQDTDAAHLLPDRPMSLLGKINRLYAMTEYIVMTANNDHDKYKYADEADVLQAIRNSILELGLVVLPPSAQSAQVIEGGKSPILLVHYENTIGHVDGEDVISRMSYGGANLNSARDKGPYVAQTGDSKYYLQKLGLLPSYDAEPESNENSEPGTTQGGSRAEQSVNYQDLADQLYNYLATAKDQEKLTKGLAAIEPRINDLKQKAPAIAKDLARRVKKLQDELGMSRADGMAAAGQGGDHAE